jgi:hypothetical protein
MIRKRIIQVGEIAFPAFTQTTMETTETQQILESTIKSGGQPLTTRLASQEVLITGSYNENGFDKYLPRQNYKRVYKTEDYKKAIHSLKQKTLRAFAIGEDNKIYSTLVKVSVPRITNANKMWFDFEIQCFNFEVYWEDVTDCVFWETFLEKGLELKVFRYNNELTFNKHETSPFLMRYLEPPNGILSQWYNFIETVKPPDIVIVSPVEEYLLAGVTDDYTLAGVTDDYTLAVSNNFEEYLLAGVTDDYTLAGVTDDYTLGGSNSLSGGGQITVSPTGVLTAVNYFKNIINEEVIFNLTGKIKIYILGIFPNINFLNKISIGNRSYSLNNYTHFVLTTAGTFMGNSFLNMQKIDNINNIFDSDVVVLYNSTSNPEVKYLAHQLIL